MAFDAQEFFRDFGVRTMSEGHKHCRPGWINTPCPFCTGNPGYHLGFNLSADFFRCWRCGFHSIVEYIREIAGVPWGKAKDLKREYYTGTRSTKDYVRKKAAASRLVFPEGTGEIGVPERAYLDSRGFSHTDLQAVWGLKSTGPLAWIESGEMTYDYRFRIIAPIRYHNNLVSFQGRDYTDKQTEKYKACPIELEVINHKEILYGMDEAKKVTRSVILVEGITDVWRMGPGTVAGFGIEMKQSQLLLLAEHFHEVFVMFDDDPQAIKQAEVIASNLSMVGVSTEICAIVGDPGDLDQNTADQYRRQLIG